MRKAVFIVALVVRIAVIEATGANRTSFGDAGDYIDTAASICTRHVYPDRGNLPFFRALGLPFFIVAATACHPHEIRAIKYALAACDAATCALIAAMALLLFARQTAWLAGLGAAFHPLFIASVCDVRSEPLFMLLLTLSIFLLLRGNHATSGVALALAALTRPSALIAIPLFAIYALARGTRHAALFVIAVVLTLAPWTVRNWVHFHRLTLVNDAGAFSLWRGTHPDVIRLDSLEGEEYRRAAWQFETSTIFEAARSGRSWSQLALENIRRDPAAQVRWTLRKAWLYWRPWLNPQEHGRAAVIASGIAYALLFLFAAVALARFADRRLAIAVIIFFAVVWLAHLPYQISLRLRVPFTDPLLLLFAAAAVVRALETTARRFNSRLCRFNRTRCRLNCTRRRLNCTRRRLNCTRRRLNRTPRRLNRRPRRFNCTSRRFNRRTSAVETMCCHLKWTPRRKTGACGRDVRTPMTVCVWRCRGYADEGSRGRCGSRQRDRSHAASGGR